MNKLTKMGDSKFLLEIDGEQPVECSTITEKKTGTVYVKLPKDNASGRTYVSVSKFDKTDIVEFETKTEHRTGLTGGGWKSKLTPDEAKEIQECEERIAAIKAEASKRETPKIDANSEEGILAAIAKLQAKLAAKKKVESETPKIVKVTKKAGK